MFISFLEHANINPEKCLYKLCFNLKEAGDISDKLLVITEFTFFISEIFDGNVEILRNVSNSDDPIGSLLVIKLNADQFKYIYEILQQILEQNAKNSQILLNRH